MNDADLDRKLQAAREPALEVDYQQDFPRQVLAGLRSPTPGRPTAPVWRLRLAWGGGLAFACLLAGFALGRWHGRMEATGGMGQDVLADAKIISETLAMFPNRVRAIERDGQGLKLVLADQPEVPRSPPLYVRISDGTNSSSMVTFSGQEIQIAGQKMTVLAEAGGGVIVMGKDFAWSSGSADMLHNGIKIEARRLAPEAL